jgi:hypothetical protein
MELSDALVNEYKGVVFEILVAQCFLRRVNQLPLLFDQCNESILMRATHYEQHLRKYSLNILAALEILAAKLAAEMEEMSHAPFSKIYLCGKDHSTDEADFLLTSVKGDVFPISVKLCKEHSFVNTKSGGILSFLETYFYSPVEQLEMNSKISILFSTFAQNFQQQHGLMTSDNAQELEHLMDFSHWIENEGELLPGHLNEEQRIILLEYYHCCAELLYESVIKLFQTGKISENHWRVLCGHSHKQIRTYTVFHKGVEHYELTRMVKESGESTDFTPQRILPFQKNQAYFVVEFVHKVLQIRVKPMRTFTTKGLKINCGVKYNHGK